MAKIDTYLKKIPADVAQIGVGALAGAAAMTAAEYLVAKPIAKSVKEYRLKLGELKAAGKTADATALEAKAPIGTKISATTIKDLTVLGLGILAKATAPKNTYTEYATDGIIFFAVADLITRKIGVASFTSEF
jgi:hypothetical protein